MFEYLLAQETAINVRVDFSGAYLLMAQHGLDSAQVGTAFEQVSGKGMAQRVRRDVLRDARPFGLDLQVVDDRDA